MAEATVPSLPPPRWRARRARGGCMQNLMIVGVAVFSMGTAGCVVFFGLLHATVEDVLGNVRDEPMAPHSGPSGGFVPPALRATSSDSPPTSPPRRSTLMSPEELEAEKQRRAEEEAARRPASERAPARSRRRRDVIDEGELFGF